jgi:hypothetical protein
MDGIINIPLVRTLFVDGMISCPHRHAAIITLHNFSFDEVGWQIFQPLDDGIERAIQVGIPRE